MQLLKAGQAANLLPAVKARHKRLKLPALSPSLGRSSLRAPGAAQRLHPRHSKRCSQQAASTSAAPQLEGGAGGAGPGAGQPGWGDSGSSSPQGWQPDEAVPADFSSPAQLQDVVVLDVAGVAALQIHAGGPSNPPERAPLAGMHCAGCTRRVKHLLEAEDAVLKVQQPPLCPPYP